MKAEKWCGETLALGERRRRRGVGGGGEGGTWRPGWRRRKSGGRAVPRRRREGGGGPAGGRGRAAASGGGGGRNPCTASQKQSLQLAIYDTVFAAGTVHGPALSTRGQNAARPRCTRRSKHGAVAAGGRRAAQVVLWCRCARVSLFPRPSVSLSVSLRPWSASPGSPAPRTGRRAWIWSAVPCRERRARRACFPPGVGLGVWVRVRGQG